jgi:AP-1 complex subunit mu
MDEMMDFGYPQTTESKILQEYITQESHKLEIQVRPPMAVTNAVSWRTEGIRYRKNEVFLDVIESVNMLVRCNLLNPSFLYLRLWLGQRRRKRREIRDFGSR